MCLVRNGIYIYRLSYIAIRRLDSEAEYNRVFHKPRVVLATTLLKILYFLCLFYCSKLRVELKSATLCKIYIQLRASVLSCSFELRKLKP